ncbi:MAG: DeoR/GlpR family DNA-binding transcription regulator [Treponema sp.]|jgi:DeoR family glycerol-3-phosphate regulon repressor|nr:DeoR/GlpR family DNA-binding transcription regulator [Treponema sp.]
MSTAAKTRHRKCLEYIENHKYTTIADLVDFLKVSPITVRRDLTVLDQQNLVTRVYGGVVPYEGHPTDPSSYPQGEEIVVRLNANMEEKKLLAQRAAGLVKDGQVVYIDAGSTCYYIARLLSEKKIMVVTNSLIVVNFLKTFPNIRLLILSGEYFQNLDGFIGTVENSLLQNIALDIAFIGTAYFDAAKGCFNGTFSETEIKNTVNSLARESYIVFDSTKTTRSSPYLSIPIERVKNIITTSRINDKANFASLLEKKNINVLFADA